MTAKSMPAQNLPAIEIENLTVEFPSSQGMLRAVDGVSLKVEQGEVLGIVGESGSGKSVAMLAAMGLVPYPGIVRAGKLKVGGHDMLALSDAQRRGIVGKDMSMIFQEPATSLNPCYTVGFQIMETLRLHEKMDRKAAKKRAVELLEQVGIPAPETRLSAFPHQLSGGMNQRVMIAMAITCNPRLLIADEPTTALDVTIQAQILDLLMSLQRERGMALILITHNMGVVSETAQRVAVMYSGQVMEQNDTDRLFADPQHPYTAALMAARPENRIGEKLATIPGTVPSLYERPAGCLFAPRCAYATPHSFVDRPALRDWKGGAVRCHYPLGDAERDAKIAADRAEESAAKESAA
jgi:dipeptide transport system ATP-binding protein